MKQGKHISRLIVNKLSEKTALGEQEQEKIDYALRIILSEGSKFLILLMLFALCHKEKEFLAAALFVFLTRTFIGGLHQNTYAACFLHSMVFFVLDVFVLEKIWYVRGTFVQLILCNLFLYLWLAPIPAKERGVFGRKARARRKCFAVAGQAVIVLMTWLFPSLTPLAISTLLLVDIEFLISFLRCEEGGEWLCGM